MEQIKYQKIFIQFISNKKIYINIKYKYYLFIFNVN